MLFSLAILSLSYNVQSSGNSAAKPNALFTYFCPSTAPISNPDASAVFPLSLLQYEDVFRGSAAGALFS